MKAWVITLPKQIEWSDYQAELDAALRGAVLNYKVRHFPKGMDVGHRCYLVHRGRVKGLDVHGMLPNLGAHLSADMLPIVWLGNRFSMIRQSIIPCRDLTTIS